MHNQSYPIAGASPSTSKNQFIRTKSKLFKKRMAPIGTLFFSVKIQKGRMTYSNVMQVNMDGMTDEKENAIWEAMEESIVKKYHI